MTEHHPLSTAAKNLARAIRQFDENPSPGPDEAEAMLRALRSTRSQFFTAEAEVLAAASDHVSVRRMAEISGYASHTPMRRKLNRILGEHDESDGDDVPAQKTVTLTWRGDVTETRTMSEKRAREWEREVGRNPTLMSVQVH